MGKKDKSKKLNHQVPPQQSKSHQKSIVALKTKHIQKQKHLNHNTDPSINQSLTKKNKTNKIKKDKVQQNVAAKPIKPQVKGKPWSQLQYKLRDQIIASLASNGFTTMLPVQQASIPLLLKNYDLAVQAQTGSGKTLSFLIPLLEKYLSLQLNSMHQQDDSLVKPFAPTIKYFIMSPTRQLCQQTFFVLTKLLEGLPSNQRRDKYLKYCYCATGGSDIKEDVERLKDRTIVFVGTVGRVRQLMEKMDQNWLKKIQYLYIDQADRVLKEKGIEQVIRSIQKVRRTAMFSATLQTLQQKNYQFYGMRNLAKISLKQTNTQQQAKGPASLQIPQDKKYIIPKSLTNTYVRFPSRLQKLSFLTNFILAHLSTSKTIIFFNTCASVDFYTKLFNTFFKLRQEDQIIGLHGKLKSNRRERLIKSFLGKQSGCLFATDVVSRGIDFDHVHFIVQVDPPEDPDNYVHRIGRTARINRPGTAILLIQNHQSAFINYLADKSVGVQEATDLSQYYPSDKALKLQEIRDSMFSIMTSDRDYIQKSKKAFVSYVRSYKQHDLRFIFQFKNVDLGLTAYSFFMLRIPRIKQILGKSISSFQQNPLDIQTIPWLDKNQQSQFLIKKQKRQQQQVQKKRHQQKLAKNFDAHNNKSKRKRIKQTRQNRQQQWVNKEHRQLMKDKKGKNRNGEDQESLDFGDEDTEQVEQRMGNNQNKHATTITKDKKINKNKKRH